VTDSDVNIRLGEDIKVLLIICFLLRKIELPFQRERAILQNAYLPSHLPEIYLSDLAPYSIFIDWLSRHRRAVPSASLDKSAVFGLLNCFWIIPYAGKCVKINIHFFIAENLCTA
jgi:hypothetical protein